MMIMNFFVEYHSRENNQSYLYAICSRHNLIWPLFEFQVTFGLVKMSTALNTIF